MSFVKLDCGLLDSTLWIDRVARELFITSLLMAEPHELKIPMKQYNVRDLNETGFIIPEGWYGFVPAAGTGIIHRAGIEHEEGLAALERLGMEDHESRSPDFGGRRLVRIDGGYIVLNFVKYRDKDSTTAERSRRWRERQKLKALTTRVAETPSRVIRHQAEAEAEAEENTDTILSKPSKESNEPFESFWMVYPKKKAKGKARVAFEKALKMVTLEEVLSALGRLVVSPDWIKEGGKYVPHPASWLNSEGWHDQVEVPVLRSKIASDGTEVSSQSSWGLKI